jgi:PKD repeat protein
LYGAGNALIGTLTAPPYNLRWPNVAAGSYAFTAKVTDSQGLNTTSAAASITVGSSVTIQFAGGMGGGSVDDDSIYVGGTISAPPNSAVNVNGQLATVTGSGQFFLNDLQLTAGANTVTATVTTPDGQTASQVITITRSATVALFTVSVTPSGIVAPGTPFDADVTIDNPGNAAFATITLQCADPAVGINVMQVGNYKCTYTTPGIYNVRVTVRDAGNSVVYMMAKVVKVETPQARYQSIVSIYSEFTDRLKAGNIDGALNAFTSTVREKYRTAFSGAGAGLTAMVNGFGVISAASINDRFAELIVVKTTAQGDVASSVIMVRATDGIWRVDGF